MKKAGKSKRNRRDGYLFLRISSIMKLSIGLSIFLNLVMQKWVVGEQENFHMFVPQLLPQKRSFWTLWQLH